MKFPNFSAHRRFLGTFTSPGPTFLQTGVSGKPLHRLAPAASDGSNDTRGWPFTPVCAKVGLGRIFALLENARARVLCVFFATRLAVLLIGSELNDAEPQSM